MCDRVQLNRLVNNFFKKYENYNFEEEIKKEIERCVTFSLEHTALQKVINLFPWKERKEIATNVNYQCYKREDNHPAVNLEVRDNCFLGDWFVELTYVVYRGRYIYLWCVDMDVCDVQLTPSYRLDNLINLKNLEDTLISVSKQSFTKRNMSPYLSCWSKIDLNDYEVCSLLKEFSLVEMIEINNVEDE